MKEKKSFAIALAFTVITVVLCVLIAFADVGSIAPNGGKVGLSQLNQRFFGFFGVNMFWYVLTDWLGLVGVFVAFLFFIAGVAQWIQRKNILRVEVEILGMGAIYLILIAIYVIFERYPVNFRPIIMPGANLAEASFPSSHVLMVCSILFCAGECLKEKTCWKKVIRNAIFIAIWGVVCITVIGRLLSGVHWLSDILAGVGISLSLTAWYRYIVKKLKIKNE